jgi:Ca-activated chloride channel family protein
VKLTAIVLLITLPFVDRFTRETNSHAATARGVKQFAQKKYADAQQSFSTATSIAPTPARAFNLGTSQIAAGNREAGSTTIAKALADPSLRADALFNRGNSALSANAFDYAIRDYTDALRIRPTDAAAKRNLEIALRRKQAMQKQQGGGSGSQQDRGPEPKQKPQPAPQQGGQQQPKNDPNVDGLLRSVQQQEQEELSRMHRPSRERLHVGW